ncbi:MAG TPA: O-antigen ligase family protein [Nocardioidaceae bacterium]|nr:O-antigen ligase family protein [Nocardioidaceae bacterium]
MTVRTELAPAPAPAAERLPPARTALLLSAILLSAAGGTVSAVGLLNADKPLVVVPLALAVGAVAAALAVTRFAVFVMLMIALRASVDVSKLTPSSQSATRAQELSSRVLTPSTLVVGLFIVAAALWLLAQARSGNLHRGLALRRAWVLFALTGFLSLLASADRTRTLVGAAQVLAIALMYVVLDELMTDVRTRNRLLTAVYASALGPLLYTIAGFALGNPAAQVKGDFLRLAGTFTQTNDFGRYLMILILFGVAVFRHVKRNWRPAFALMIGTCAVFMLLTYTLTAIFGTALGLLVLGIWHSRRVLVGLVVAGLCAFVVAPQLVARVNSVGPTSASYNSPGYHSSSLLWRFSYWEQVLPLANADPVTGIGLNMTATMTEQNKQPHNDFLRAYVEEGVVGELAFLAVLAAMVALGVRATRASPRGSLDRGVGAGFLACAVAIVASSAADNVFTNVAVQWYLVAFAAAASSVVRRRRDQ